MKCPECNSEDVSVTYINVIHKVQFNGGMITRGDTDLTNGFISNVTCNKCNYSGTAKEFGIPMQQDPYTDVVVNVRLCCVISEKVKSLLAAGELRDGIIDLLDEKEIDCISSYIDDAKGECHCSFEPEYGEGDSALVEVYKKAKREVEEWLTLRAGKGDDLWRVTLYVYTTASI